jgi:hypothetical protein
MSSLAQTKSMNQAMSTSMSMSKPMSLAVTPSRAHVAPLSPSGGKRNYDIYEAGQHLSVDQRSISFIRSAFARTSESSDHPMSESEAKRFIHALHTLVALYQVMPYWSRSSAPISRGLVEATSQRFGLIPFLSATQSNVNHRLRGQVVRHPVHGRYVMGRVSGYDVNRVSSDSSELTMDNSRWSLSASNEWSDMSRYGSLWESAMFDMQTLNRVLDRSSKDRVVDSLLQGRVVDSLSSGRVLDMNLIDEELKSNVVGYAWENGATIKHALECRC